MMKNLWSNNSPANFWRCLANITDDQWQDAFKEALPVNGITLPDNNIDVLLEIILGEKQFGANHWRLNFIKRLYYDLKPLIPRWMIRLLRKNYNISHTSKFLLGWPIEDRYARFQWRIMRLLLEITGITEMPFIYFWPEGRRCAFILTHDIETEKGQAYAWKVLELESSLGYKSSFNIIPERYPIDKNLLNTLRLQGFEIGVHGLKHDGKLFSSYNTFTERSHKINSYLKDFGACGFRSPLTHRQPEWMQALEIEYDLSFFDTDPFEPIPGGVMSIWPFEIGKFIELPYTLVQDYSLVELLGNKSPDVWLQKVDFLESYHGLILINTHPDYLINPENWNVYVDFLKAMKDRNNYWLTLPKEASSWWRSRMTATTIDDLPGGVVGTVILDQDDIMINL
jgi:hypothetical protein